MSSEQETNITFDVLWRSLTHWDKLLLALFAITVALGFALPANLLALACQLTAYILGFALLIRLLRRFVRHIVWRLRNRLLVAYGFIAVVPVLLVTALFALLVYAISGQVATFLVTNELERRTALIVSLVQHLAEEDTERGQQTIAQAYTVLAGRLPGLELLVESSKVWKHPEAATIESPGKDWGDAGGLLVKDGLLYAWAHITRPHARVTALLPLTSRFLASLAPNIGQVIFLRLDEDLTQPRRKLRLHRSSGEVSEAEPRNLLPEKQNRFDIMIPWATALPVFLWESPGRVENEVLSIRTRPFALFNIVFAQKVDDWSEIPTALAVAISLAFLISEVISLFIGVSITRTITGAVHDLYEGTERIKEGVFSHRIRIKGQDQLATLGESFNTMTAHIERLLVIAKENERIQAELEIAREVQNQLYPRVMPELKTLRVKALCNPARMVSGDYYDCQQLDKSRLAIAVGDVAGKGISAALLMATVQSALRTQVRHCLEVLGQGQPAVSTSLLVSQLNKHLYAHTTPEKYATFCFCVYNEPDSTLTYTNAGHLPPILLRGGEPQTLEVNGTVVGAFPFSRYEESHIRLESGDLLLFYTDGITEAENAYGEQFGEEHLFEILRKHHDCPPAEILGSIIQQVADWTGSTELQDDMTLLLAHRI